MGFADHLALQCERVLEEVDKKCYSIVYHFFTSVVMKTPSPANPGKWAKGLLVNQWYPSTGGAYSSELTTSVDSKGSGSLTRINALSTSKEFFKKDGTMTMTNNVPYGWQAEYGGWVRTPAYGMIRVSLQETVARYM